MVEKRAKKEKLIQRTAKVELKRWQQAKAKAALSGIDLSKAIRELLTLWVTDEVTIPSDNKDK